MSDTDTDTDTDTDVLVVGLGPVGAALTALLGQAGVRVIAVERDHQPYPTPRAIAVDDEVLRILVRLPGLAGMAEAVNGLQRAAFTDRNLRVLAEVSFGETELGYPGLAFFDQPSTERALRAGIAGLPTVSVRLGHTVTDLRQDGERVTVELRTDGGGGGGGSSSGARRLSARWVVGCDGASSTVRRLLAVDFDGITLPARWLVVDADTDRPLARLPYFCYVCDPAQPAVTMPRPGGHRFEWMLRPEETACDVELCSPARLRPLLARFTDPDRLRIVRAAVYTFHARSARRWRSGRVLLAGDAAHCMPQFAGQGLGAGIRDAAALAWRLGEICAGVSGPGILDGYEAERRRHVAAMTDLALLTGRIVQAGGPVSGPAVRAVLRAIGGTPVIGTRLGSVRPRQTGMLPSPRIRTLHGRLRRLDDVLPPRWVVLVAGDGPWPPRLPRRLVTTLRTRSAGAVVVVPPGGLRSAADVADAADAAVPVIEDLDGTLLRLLRSGPLLARPDRVLVPVRRPGAAARMVAAAVHRLAQP